MELSPRRPKYLLLFCVALLFLLSACKFKLNSGFYSGNLSISSVNGIEDRVSEPVQVQVTKESGKLLIQIFKNDDNPIPLLLPITLSGKKSVDRSYKKLTLTLPNLSDEPFQLTLNALDKYHLCFSNHGDYRIDLCLDKEHLSLDVSRNGKSKISFFGELSEPQDPVKGPDVPTELTLRNALRIAFANNAEILDEKENVFQAKERAKKAYLSLLPHFNLNPLLVATVGELCGFFEFGTGLIPFLLPSKWMDARLMQYQARAHELGETALLLNIAASIHIQTIKQVSLSELLARLIEVRNEVDQVAKVLRKDKDQPSKLDDIQIVSDKLNIAIRRTEERIDEALEDLSHALGLETSDKIKQILLEQETPALDQIVILDEQQMREEKRKLGKAALLNSFELRQLRVMKDAALINEKLIYVGWLGSNDYTPLGFNLISDNRIVKSATMVINNRMNATRKRLNNNTHHLIQERNEWKLFSLFVQNSLSVRQKKWNQLYQNILISGLAQSLYNSPHHSSNQSYEIGPRNIQMDEVKHTIEDLIEGLDVHHSTSAIISMKQAELDRVSGQGLYFDLLKERHQNEDIHKYEDTLSESKN